MWSFAIPRRRGLTPGRALALLLTTFWLGGCASLNAPRGSEQLYADFLSARFAEERDDAGVAARAYQRALRAAPDRRELIEGALISSLRAGEFQRALAAARHGVDQGFDNPPQRLTLAADAMARRDYAAARHQLQGLTGAPVERLAGSMMSAWVEAGRGDGVAALAALGDEPGRPLGGLLVHQRALLQDYWGDTSSALDSYARASESVLPSALTVDRQARLLRRQGQSAEAEAAVLRAIARNPNPLLQTSLDQIRSGAPPGPNLSPSQGAAIGVFSIAAVLAGQSDPSFYLPLVTLALALDPKLDAARLLAAEAFNAEAQRGAALAMLDRVDPKAPLGPVALAQAAWTLQRMDKPDAAIGRLTLARSDHPLIRRATADLLRVQRRWPEAESAYGAMIATLNPPQPADWGLFFARGATRERQSKWAAAEADLQEALRLNPNQPDALNYLAYSWVERGERLNEAVDMLHRAVRNSPSSGAIADSLGWAYFKLGRYDEALTQLERAWSLEPGDATVNHHLGDVYAKLGRERDAIVLWRRALTLDPEPAEKAAIEAKLASADAAMAKP
jgi:tetratricopeptide (TPR) repeat protein